MSLDPINPKKPQGKNVVISDNAGTLDSIDLNSFLYLAVPRGSIIAWSGNPATIPEGWALCDGRSTGSIQVPDLRGKFIVGYQSGSYDIGATGGSPNHTISIDEMPSHTHILRNHTSADGWCKNPPCGLYATDMGPRDDKEAVSGNGLFRIDPTGGGRQFDIRPPYYALAYIMKL